MFRNLQHSFSPENAFDENKFLRFRKDERIRFNLQFFSRTKQKKNRNEI